MASSAVFAGDGKRVLTASEDGSARIWNIRPPEVISLEAYDDDDVVSAAFSRDAKRVITGKLDETARIWDATTGEELRELDVGAEVVGVAFSSNGRWVMTASNKGSTTLWDSASGDRIRELTSNGFKILNTSFSLDGRQIFTASADCAARIIDAESGGLVAELAGQTGECRTSAFTSDGRYVLTAGDVAARLWDNKTGTLRPIKGFTNGAKITNAALDPNGRSILAVTARKPFVYVLNIVSGQVIALEGHENPVAGAAFSPGGQQIV